MTDWILDRMGWILLAMAAVVGGLLWWAIGSMNDWEARCHSGGGVVESRYIGDTIIIVNNAPIITPHYSYHCMLNGAEIDV